MEKYNLEIARSAEKTLHRLPREAVQKISVAIGRLAENPYPPGCRKLEGQARSFRIRVGVYRIIYEVYQDLILIKILKIGHRKDVYRS